MCEKCEKDSEKHALMRAMSAQRSDVFVPQAARVGSRRRRLWELDHVAHCPVVGVCVPLQQMRTLIGHLVMTPDARSDDYALHCVAVTECRQRSAIAEILQRELERRYPVSVRQATRLKSEDVLVAWWVQALADRDVAGPLWAILSHPRTTPALRDHVLGDVHMLQHQAGAAARVDVQRMQTLAEQNRHLSARVLELREHDAQSRAESARQATASAAELMRLRAQSIGRDSTIEGLRAGMRKLEADAPGLKNRLELTRQAERQLARIRELEHALNEARREAERERGRAERAGVAAVRAQEHDAAPQPAAREGAGSMDAGVALEPFGDRAVLCVGGRTASVPHYRRLVESAGGRFIHHDGGEEDNVARLESTLATADLVICQTGCISHDAYWRVKDHCKRTGKRCVFVENPSPASLKRVLADLAPQTAA